MCSPAIEPSRWRSLKTLSLALVVSRRPARVYGIDRIDAGGVRLFEEELRRELGGHLGGAGVGADLEVNVRRAPLIPAGKDGLEGRRSGRVRHLIAPQPGLMAGHLMIHRVVFVRVDPDGIGMPDVDMGVLQQGMGGSGELVERKVDMQRHAVLDGGARRAGHQIAAVQLLIDEKRAFGQDRAGDQIDLRRSLSKRGGGAAL